MIQDLRTSRYIPIHSNDPGPQDLTLPQQGFQPSRIEAYAMMGLKDTGSIKQLGVMHTAPHPWFLSEVLAINESTGVQGLFKADR
jgi:hypothetical protein